eukprot:COSAG05_NODE_3334_length_2145_cov_2.370479_1_plen_108_part_00
MTAFATAGELLERGLAALRLPAPGASPLLVAMPAVTLGEIRGNVGSVCALSVCALWCCRDFCRGWRLGRNGSRLVHRKTAASQPRKQLSRIIQRPSVRVHIYWQLFS